MNANILSTYHTTQDSRDSTYDPDRLFDTLMSTLGAGSDKALSRRLQMSVHTLRGLRARRLPLRACVLSQIAEYSRTDVRALRETLGDRRCKVRLI